MKIIKQTCFFLLGLLFMVSCKCDSELVKITDSSAMFGVIIPNDALIFLPDSTNGTLEGFAHFGLNSNNLRFIDFEAIEKNDSFHVILKMFLKIEPERSECNTWFGNSIDTNSFRLSCDENFIFRDSVIYPSENILDLISNDGFPVALEPIWESENEISCLMRNVFFMESKFNKKRYSFSLICNTNDGVIIRNRVLIRFV